MYYVIEQSYEDIGQYKYTILYEEPTEFVANVKLNRHPRRNKDLGITNKQYAVIEFDDMDDAKNFCGGYTEFDNTSFKQQLLTLLKTYLPYFTLQVNGNKTITIRYTDHDTDIEYLMSESYVKSIQHRMDYDTPVPIELKSYEFETIGKIYGDIDKILAITPNFKYNPYDDEHYQDKFFKN